MISNPLEELIKVRGYYVYRKGDKHVYKDEVTFGIYYIGDGTTGEMGMIWDDVGAYLRCYDDAFSSLAEFKDVIDRVAADECVYNVDHFIEILDDCGFINMYEFKGQENEYKKLEKYWFKILRKQKLKRTMK